MKISFLNSYKSIHNFNEIEVPNFCVLVGKNGSGKTHILKAIEAGHIKTDDIRKEKITYFNFHSFLIKNQRPITVRNLEDEKESAWKLVEEIKRVYQDHREEDDSISIRRFIEKRTKENLKLKCLVETGIFLSKKKLKDLDRNTFLKYSEYDPDDYELLNSLSEICFEYLIKIITARLPIEEGGQQKNKEEMIELEKNSPWQFINRMFEVFGLPHKIKVPKFNAADILRNGNIRFEAKPIYENNEISFEDLSSGERILCALAITVFQDQKNKKFPELLLLDEIDASLHPSMVKNLLSVINDVFIKNNCKIILATHSPTTTSLVDESAIFEVKPFQVQNKIEKINQIKAVEILSEGMMTLEKGLTLFDQITRKPLSIITEGKNTQHLSKAISILDPNLFEKIDIIKGAENSSGIENLKTLFEFFKRVDHKNAVLFVFDCDAKNAVSSKKEVNNTFLFCLPNNPLNKVANNGIENMYIENLFDEFISTNTDSLGKTEKKFDPRRKNDFLKKIELISDTNIFKNYESLIEKINSILKIQNISSY